MKPAPPVINARTRDVLSLCSRGSTFFAAPVAPPPGALARAFALARAQGCRSPALGGAALPRFPPAGPRRLALAAGASSCSRAGAGDGSGDLAHVVVRHAG